MSFYGYTPIPMDYSGVKQAGQGFGQAAGAIASGVAGHFQDRKVKKEVEQEQYRLAAAYAPEGTLDDDGNVVGGKEGDWKTAQNFARRYYYAAPGLHGEQLSAHLAKTKDAAWKAVEEETTKRRHNKGYSDFIGGQGGAGQAGDSSGASRVPLSAGTSVIPAPRIAGENFNVSGADKNIQEMNDFAIQNPYHPNSPMILDRMIARPGLFHGEPYVEESDAGAARSEATSAADGAFVPARERMVTPPQFADSASGGQDAPLQPESTPGTTGGMDIIDNGDDEIYNGMYEAHKGILGELRRLTHERNKNNISKDQYETHSKLLSVEMETLKIIEKRRQDRIDKAREWAYKERAAAEAAGNRMKLAEINARLKAFNDEINNDARKEIAGMNNTSAEKRTWMNNATSRRNVDAQQAGATARNEDNISSRDMNTIRNNRNRKELKEMDIAARKEIGAVKGNGADKSESLEARWNAMSDAFKEYRVALLAKTGDTKSRKKAKQDAYDMAVTATENYNNLVKKKGGTENGTTYNAKKAPLKPDDPGVLKQITNFFSSDTYKE